MKFVKVAVIESDSWENHAKMKILPLFLPLELIGLQERQSAPALQT